MKGLIVTWTPRDLWLKEKMNMNVTFQVQDRKDWLEDEGSSKSESLNKAAIYSDWDYDASRMRGFSFIDNDEIIVLTATGDWIKRTRSI